MSAKHLKNCPFCGAYICLVGAEPRLMMSMHNKGCIFNGLYVESGFPYCSEEEVAEAWNNRVEPTKEVDNG